MPRVSCSGLVALRTTPSLRPGLGAAERRTWVASRPRPAAEAERRIWVASRPRRDPVPAGRREAAQTPRRRDRRVRARGASNLPGAVSQWRAAHRRPARAGSGVRSRRCPRNRALWSWPTRLQALRERCATGVYRPSWSLVRPSGESPRPRRKTDSRLRKHGHVVDKTGTATGERS